MEGGGCKIEPLGSEARAFRYEVYTFSSLSLECTSHKLPGSVMRQLRRPETRGGGGHVSASFPSVLR